MHVILDSSTVYVNERPDKVTYRDGKERPVWIGRRPICASRYIKDGLYLDRDGDMTGNISANREYCNVEFNQILVAHSPKLFKDYLVLTIPAVWYIRIG